MLWETKPRPSRAGQSARWPWLGVGRRKSGKREVVNEEERGGRSRVGRKEMRNYKENVMKRREVEGAEWGGKRGIIRRT